MCALSPQLHELAEQDRLLAALSDRRARVAHDACTVLGHDYIVPRERLWTLLATATRPHTRNCVVRLFARGGCIESMTWLLHAAAFADKAVRQQACTHLQRWGTGWQQVPPLRLAAFRVALDRASPFLPDDLRKRLWDYDRYVDGAASLQFRPVAPQRLVARPRPATRKRPALRTPAAKPASAKCTPTPAAQPLRLPGCVVQRKYELPPRRWVVWRWLLPR
jgi:hypothetical protein